MTIASQTTAETMLGDGANRKFPFTFRAWEDEVNVVLTDPEDRNTDVTGLADIQIAKDSPGGVVTYPAADGAAPLLAGWKLTVLRNMNFLQAVRLVNATRYDPLVIEQALDRLTAACQQLREMADRAAHIPVGSDMTADEFLSVIYDARALCLAAMQEVAEVMDRVGGELDEKMAETIAALEAELADCLARVEPLVERAEDAASGVENFATLAQKWAVFPEDTPVTSADPDDPHSPALFSAYHWAQKAQAAAGVHDASETQKGIAFAATAEEVETGATDPARGGVPAFITPEALGAFTGGGDGLPLLSVTPVLTGIIESGYLSVCADNGELTAVAFPEAAAKVRQIKALNPAMVLSMSAWLAEKAAQGGICGRFALSDDEQTFRIPCAPGAYWRGLSAAGGFGVGDWQRDQFQGHSFGSSSATTPTFDVMRDVVLRWTAGNVTNVSSVVLGDRSETPSGAAGGLDKLKYTADEYNNGAPRVGSETRPLSVVCDWQMKLYGTVTDEGSVTLAQLIAAMAGKLDTSVWEANSPKKALAKISAAGTILNGFGITSVSRTATGIYTVYSPHINATTAKIFVQSYGSSGVSISAINDVAAGQISVQLRESSSMVVTDAPFVIEIY